MGIIQLNQVTIGYPGQAPIISDLTLTIPKGKFVTLLGESGSGKTTLLKAINGLVPHQSGDLSVMGKTLKEWDMIQLRRRIGYVIQQIGLFPHMTIADNITYVPSLDKSKPVYGVEELLDLVGIETSYKDRYPRELSGGQRQRVGVARALANDPEVLLMDEPFGAVDEITRGILQDEIMRIQSKLNKTILFVTHDIEEALKLGDQILLMKSGRIEQNGTKQEMIFNHATPYVTEFFGDKHFNAYLNMTRVSEWVDANLPFEPGLSSIQDDVRLIKVIEGLLCQAVQAYNVFEGRVYMGRLTVGAQHTNEGSDGLEV